MEVEKRRYVGIDLGKRTYEMAIVGKNISVKKLWFQFPVFGWRSEGVLFQKGPSGSGRGQCHSALPFQWANAYRRSFL